MGAWGTGPFENDGALDFAHEVLARGLPALRGVLEAALDPEEASLDSAEATRALAAAEIIRIGGVTADAAALPRALEPWVRGADPEQLRALAPLAARAVARVLGPESELRELWEDTRSAPLWLAVTGALREALDAAGGPKSPTA